MNRLVAESYLLLLWTELITMSRGFRGLYRQVRHAAIKTSRPDSPASVEQLGHAMDFACVLYPKRVFCLQRSAATILLFRRHGIRAEMVLGAQILPFQSHAWVEVNGTVANDKPYMREIYKVLESC